MPAFFRAVEKIKPVYDWTYKILMFICKLLLIGDIIITAWAVTGRYVPLAIRRGAHIRMTAFDTYLPKKVLLVSDIIADLAVMALGVVLVIYGIKFCNSPLSIRGKYASIPTLSKFWQYLPIPVAGAGMIIFELEQVFQHVEAFFVKDEKREVA